MKIETIFQILAVVLAGAAAYFLWIGQRDGAFVSVVLGCVAFFLSVRFQVKKRNEERAAAVLLEEQASAEGSPLPKDE